MSFVHVNVRHSLTINFDLILMLPTLAKGKNELNMLVYDIRKIQHTRRGRILFQNQRVVLAEEMGTS